MGRTVKRPDVRKQELLDIGFPLYMEYGSNGLNVKEIAAKANVSVGLFYYYFKSKEDYIAQLLDSYIGNHVSTVQTLLEDTSLSPAEKIKSTLDVLWLHAKNTDAQKTDAAFRTEQHYAMTNTLLMELKPSVQRVIEAGMADGTFRKGNPSLVSGYILYGVSSVLDSEQSIQQMSYGELQDLVWSALK